MSDLVRGPGRGWFAVLPDDDAAWAGASNLVDRCTEVITHASGRPWLVGDWVPEEVTSAAVGANRIVLVGMAGMSGDRLRSLCTTIGDQRELDTAFDGVAGSFHLVASLAGQVRVQGSASGLRRVFSTVLSGVTICSDRADVLARLTGATPDECGMALRLLGQSLPHPLSDRSVWRGVRAVPPGRCVVVDRAGRAREARWWRAPRPHLSLSRGAPALAAALEESVRLRTQPGGTISADLSGGLDSTPLCFLSAAGPARLVTVTVAAQASGHDDAAWARKAIQLLPKADSRMIDAAELAPMFSELGAAAEDADEPYPDIRVRSRSAEIARRMIAAGSRLHLSGEGGDQVLKSHVTYLHEMVRTQPVLAIAHLRAWRSRIRWRWWPTLRALADGRDYPTWLAETTSDLRPTVIGDITPTFGWHARPSMPPWVTPAAADMVRHELRVAAAGAVPLAAARAQHESLVEIQHGAWGMRQLARGMANDGLPVEFPYVDDNVIAASLSVRSHERTTPFDYKPLIVDAMRGRVPDELLERRTKASFDEDLHLGLRAQRTLLADWLDDPLLGRMGLVDVTALRQACLGLHPPRLSLAGLEVTLACEAWLRAISGKVGK